MEFIFKLFRRSKKLVLFTIAGNVFTILITLWWNQILSIIMNDLSEGNKMDKQVLLLAGVIIIVSVVSAYSLSLLSGYTCEIMTHKLRMGYARHFLHLEISEIEAMNAGGQLSKLQNEMNEVSQYLNGNLFQLINNVIRFVATFTWLLWLNPKLTILVNLPVIFILFYVTYSSKVIGALTEEGQQAKMQMNGFTDTLLVLFPVISVYSAANLILDKYKAQVKQWEDCEAKAERTSARLMSFSAMLSCIPTLLLLLIGGTMIINGQTTLGTLYIFINLSGNVSGVMMNMPGFIASFRHFSANVRRLEECIVMDEGR